MGSLMSVTLSLRHWELDMMEFDLPEPWLSCEPFLPPPTPEPMEPRGPPPAPPVGPWRDSMLRLLLLWPPPSRCSSSSKVYRRNENIKKNSQTPSDDESIVCIVRYST